MRRVRATAPLRSTCATGCCWSAARWACARWRWSAARSTLQVVNNDFYRQQGDARFLREIPIPTSRGMITDRNGEPLAVSTPVESVWGNPQELLKNPARIPELAQGAGRAAGLPDAQAQPARRQGIPVPQAPHQPRPGAQASSPTTSRACSRSASSVASTRRARRWRTSWASPTSTTSARKGWNWRSTTGCAASPAPSA